MFPRGRAVFTNLSYLLFRYRTIIILNIFLLYCPCTHISSTYTSHLKSSLISLHTHTVFLIMGSFYGGHSYSLNCLPTAFINTSSWLLTRLQSHLTLLVIVTRPINIDSHFAAGDREHIQCMNCGQLLQMNTSRQCSRFKHLYFLCKHLHVPTAHSILLYV